MKTALALVLAGVLVTGCGDDDHSESTDESQQEAATAPPGSMPVEPTFGVNAFAYEGLGVDTLFEDGLSGAGVNVCVIDTGIDPDHPAFAHTFERGAVAWADFTTERSPTPIDTNGHGTHVAGIIAMNDELTGGAPNVDLLIARVFTAEGGADFATIARAVDWCSSSAADVISMSLGGLTLPAIEELLDEDPTETEQAVERALDAGVYVVAAAGNTELARDVASPSNVSGVVAVAALEPDLETKAAFSQSGINEGGALLVPRTDPDKKPELSAPGVGITSAMVSGSTLAQDVRGCSGVAYCALNGTSQATPFVTAVLALALEARPEFQRENLTGDPRDAVALVKSALAESATALPEQALPHDDGVGYGLVQGPQLLDAL
ncbi:MAG: S8 family serine peptidase [Myxococcota bacterium]